MEPIVVRMSEPAPWWMPIAEVVANVLLWLRGGYDEEGE